LGSASSVLLATSMAKSERSQKWGSGLPVGVRILRAKPRGGATIAIGTVAVSADRRSGLLRLRITLRRANHQAARNDPRHGDVERREARVHAGEFAEFPPRLNGFREPMTDLDPTAGRFANVFLRWHYTLVNSHG